MKKLLVVNRNRKTKRKAPNAIIDLVYELCKLSINKCNKYKLLSETNTNRQSFDDCLGLAIDNGWIKLIDPPKEDKKSKYYYEITNEGREYIIDYEKMATSIERMDMKFKVDNRPIRQPR